MPASSGSTQAPAQHRVGGAEHPHCLHHLLETTAAAPEPGRRLTRLLVNVTVDRSLWPLHLVLGADATVADLVRAAVAAYVREGRRPPIHHQHHPGDGAGGGADAADGFELHFSKYSLESLRPEEKVLDLGSRNFFLWPRRSAAAS